MHKIPKYIAREVDANGVVAYTQEENVTWEILFNRQMKILKNRACDEFIHGLKLLNMSSDHIPQPEEINRALTKATGWRVQPVDCVIPADEFFTLLANKKFPAATFIRSRDELDYLEEPDIFHELFGHCPLLTMKPYADFVEAYGKMALRSEKSDLKYLFRLFWFTIEFGLIETSHGRRIMGGGILSSYDETLSALEQPDEFVLRFDVDQALRTVYNINEVQPQYFVINGFESMYDILSDDLPQKVQIAKTLPEIFPVRMTKKGVN